jgi:hypothetical protein
LFKTFTDFFFIFLISVLHTSASLALNESWDPDVRYIILYFKCSGFWPLTLLETEKPKTQKLGKTYTKEVYLSLNYSLNIVIRMILNFCRDDMEMMLNKIVPEGLPYRHSCEGPDDMVSILTYWCIWKIQCWSIYFSRHMWKLVSLVVRWQSQLQMVNFH